MKLSGNTALLALGIFLLPLGIQMEEAAYSTRGTVPDGVNVTRMSAASSFISRSRVLLYQEHANIVVEVDFIGTATLTWHAWADMKNTSNKHLHQPLRDVADVEERGNLLIGHARILEVYDATLNSIHCKPGGFANITAFFKAYLAPTHPLNLFNPICDDWERHARALGLLGLSILSIAKGLSIPGVLSTIGSLVKFGASQYQMHQLRKATESRINDLEAKLQVGLQNARIRANNYIRQQHYHQLSTTTFRLSDNVIDTINAAWQKQFSVHLLTHEVVKGSLEKLAQKTKAYHKQAAVTEAADLTQIAASVAKDKDGKIFIVGHVPVAPNAYLFRLYRFIPIPIFNEDSQAYFVYDTKGYDYVAIGDETDNFKAMTADEVRHCKDFKQMLACKAPALHYESKDDPKPLDPHRCLFSLRKHYAEDAEVSCAVQPSFLTQDVVEVGFNSFAVYSREGTRITVSCPTKQARENKEQDRETWETAQVDEAIIDTYTTPVLLQLEDQCKATSDWFSVRGSASNHMENRKQANLGADATIWEDVAGADRDRIATMLDSRSLQEGTRAGPQRPDPDEHSFTFGGNWAMPLISIATSCGLVGSAVTTAKAVASWKKFVAVDKLRVGKPSGGGGGRGPRRVSRYVAHIIGRGAQKALESAAEQGRATPNSRRRANVHFNNRTQAASIFTINETLDNQRRHSTSEEADSRRERSESEQIYPSIEPKQAIANLATQAIQGATEGIMQAIGHKALNGLAGSIVKTQNHGRHADEERGQRAGPQEEEEEEETNGPNQTAQ